MMKDSLLTEEATKTALIMPFFNLLDYDVFNPMEFVPEYTADIGSKKGEKIDYAIMNDGNPVILIECKGVSDKLTNHDSQLFRYFTATDAKFAILTNGIVYRFFTDLEKPNIMDERPFLEIDLLNLNEIYINEIKKFTKDNFDIDTIFNTASELKYTSLITKQLAEQLNNPSSEFVKLIISDFFNGSKTTSVIDKFRPIVKKSMHQFLNDFMNYKIKIILKNNEEENDIKEDISGDNMGEGNYTDDRIVITDEELEGFDIVSEILSKMVDINDIWYKDNERYLTILYQGNVRKWICRLYFNSSKKFIAISDENKREIRHYIDDVNEIYRYKNELLKSLDKYLDKVDVK